MRKENNHFFDWKPSKTFVIIWAMTLIAFLEAVALITHLDGQVFASVIAAIAGLAGYLYKTAENKVLSKNK